MHFLLECQRYPQSRGCLPLPDLGYACTVVRVYPSVTRELVLSSFNYYVPAQATTSSNIQIKPQLLFGSLKRYSPLWLSNWFFLPSIMDYYRPAGTIQPDENHSYFLGAWKDIHPLALDDVANYKLVLSSFNYGLLPGGTPATTRQPDENLSAALEPWTRPHCWPASLLSLYATEIYAPKLPHSA